MNWFERLLDWWETSRDARLFRRANSVPNFQWLLIRAGYPDYARSPMLTTREIREWFRENYPNFRVILVDEEKHVLFYE